MCIMLYVMLYLTLCEGIGRGGAGARTAMGARDRHAPGLSVPLPRAKLGAEGCTPGLAEARRSIGRRAWRRVAVLWKMPLEK